MFVGRYAGSFNAFWGGTIIHLVSSHCKKEPRQVRQKSHLDGKKKLVVPEVTGRIHHGNSVQTSKGTRKHEKFLRLWAAMVTQRSWSIGFFRKSEKPMPRNRLRPSPSKTSVAAVIKNLPPAPLRIPNNVAAVVLLQQPCWHRQHFLFGLVWSTSLKDEIQLE